MTLTSGSTGGNVGVALKGRGGLTCLPQCSVWTTVTPVPQVSVSKTAGTATLTPGGTMDYTIVVANTGNVSADGTVVSDPMPAGITAMSLSCAASGAAACRSANGTGALNETIASLPAGTSVTYTVTATVAANPPAAVINTASITPGNGGVCAPGNTAAPCTSSVSVPPAAPGVVTPVPTLGAWALGLLAVVLCALGVRQRRWA